MRDDGRDKETIELSLHPRQVVSIVLGSAVVLGIVFYLGVTVGKDLAAGPAAPPADLLGALDEKAQRVVDRLTFADELTKADRAPAPPSRDPAPKPVPPSAAAGRESEEAPRQEKAAEAPPPEARADVSAPANDHPGEPAQEPPAAAKAPVRDLSAALLQAGGSSGSTGGSKPAGGDARAKASGAVVGGEAGAKAGAAGGDAARRDTVNPPAQGPTFTVQVASLPNRSEAESLASRLRKQGLSPWVAEADIPGKGTFYRVRVGRFANRDEAVRYLEDLKRETRMDGFVASVDR